MENYEQELDRLFGELKNQVDLSFMAMQNSPKMRQAILGMWEKKLRDFVSYTISASQKHNDKTIFKTLTKALLFR